MSNPTDRDGRRARRAAIRDRLIAEAELTAERVGRSLVCQTDEPLVHQRCHGATVCICQCHDPREDA